MENNDTYMSPYSPDKSPSPMSEHPSRWWTQTKRPAKQFPSASKGLPLYHAQQVNLPQWLPTGSSYIHNSLQRLIMTQINYCLRNYPEFAYWSKQMISHWLSTLLCTIWLMGTCMSGYFLLTAARCSTQLSPPNSSPFSKIWALVSPLTLHPWLQLQTIICADQ